MKYIAKWTPPATWWIPDLTKRRVIVYDMRTGADQALSKGQTRDVVDEEDRVDGIKKDKKAKTRSRVKVL